MWGRTLAVFLLGFAITTILSAEEKNLTLKAGDRIMIVQKGDLLKKINEVIDSYCPTHRFNMKYDTRVTHVLKNGRYRIYGWTEIQEAGKSPMLLTISTVIEASEVKPSIADSDDPADIGLKEVLGERNKNEVRVELSDVAKVQLRSWKLDEEITK